MASVELSVVIPCYNGNATLGLQLEALSRQEDAPPFEVVVVDNRSTTPPDSVVEQWIGRVPGLRIVRATEGQGISVARNVGVREAAAERIALCDADDAAGPLFARAAVAGLEQADLVSGAVTLLDGREFDGGLDHVWSLLPDPGDPAAPLDVADSDMDPRYPILMGGACALRRDAVLTLDGWDQAFFPGVEDNDFALRAVAAGLTMGKSWAMTLAERGRVTSGATFKRAYDGGYMHMKLCAEHDLWATSPNLHAPHWMLDLAKLPLAGARMMTKPRAERDVTGLAGRTGLRTGQAAGYVTYRLCRRPIERQVGLGLR